jgi:ABC-type polysaccharide/polyol phosphate transport system ATPase subunit
MTDWAIRTRGLGKLYRLYARPIDRLKEIVSPWRRRRHKELWALRDVSVEIARGTVTGLVGKNGAGKSTFLKLAAGKLAATEGTIEAQGRISSILELGTGFQPHLTGRQNALVNSLFLGQRPWEAEAKLDQIIDFAELGDFADQPLSTYSSGMQARLAFAVLTTLDPEVLILDEALATGDAGFADKCKRFLRQLCRSGCTTLVASHDYPFVAETCDRVLWIDHGQVKGDGAPLDAIRGYLGSLARDAALGPRPQNVLLKIEAEDPSSKHTFIVHCFEWVAPDGAVMASHYVGDEAAFARLLDIAAELGFGPIAATGGWGPSQQVIGAGLDRGCRPDLGPGGAAYLALPLPRAPQPLPAALRVVIRRRDEPGRAVLSMQTNGRFREIARTDRSDDQDPFRRVEYDVRAFFEESGTRAPPFDDKTAGRFPAKVPS